ncbi:MAG: nucleotidyltransferase domain-containing protein [Saprospiraceae bacterium]
MLTPSQQRIILEVLQPFNPVEVGVFGSFARGEETSESDIDILVDFGETRLTLFDLVPINLPMLT